MALPTSRRSGLGGTATLTNAVPSDVYDGADISGWNLTVTQTTIEASTKSDLAEVVQIARVGATVTIDRLVAATVFTKTALLGTTLALVLTSGDGSALGGSGGDTVFSGNVVITKIGYQSPDGLEAEDLECRTVDDDWTLAA